MSMGRILEWHHDAGHGWLVVDTELVVDVAVNAAKHAASQYSYRSGTLIALEEDCDVQAFIDYFPEEWKDDIVAQIRMAPSVHHDGEAPLRAWERAA